MQKITKKTWILLSIVWAAQALCQIIQFSYGMMLPNIMADFSLDYGTAGMIGSAAGIASVIMTIPTTLLASKFNPRYSMPIVILIISVGMCLFGMATNVPMLFIGKIMVALVGNTLATALVIVKISRVPVQRVGQINGIENFVGPIGQIIATLCMAQLLVLLKGWRNIHIIIGVILFVLLILWVVFYRQDKSEVSKTANAQSNTDKEIKPFKTALKQKPFWLLAIGWPGTTLIWIGMFYFWTSYVQEAYGMTTATAGMVLSFIPIFSAIASLTSPKLADKIGKDKVLIWPWGFILPLMYFGMLNTSNIVLLCVFSAIAGYGAYCFVPLAFTTLYKLGLHPKVVSMGTAMIMTGVALGTALGSGIVGKLINIFGMYKALAICCLSPILFGVLTLFLPERGRKAMEAKEVVKNDK